MSPICLKRPGLGRNAIRLPRADEVPSAWTGYLLRVTIPEVMGSLLCVIASIWPTAISGYALGPGDRNRRHNKVSTSLLVGLIVANLNSTRSQSGGADPCDRAEGSSSRGPQRGDKLKLLTASGSNLVRASIQPCPSQWRRGVQYLKLPMTHLKTSPSSRQATSSRGRFRAPSDSLPHLRSYVRPSQ